MDRVELEYVYDYAPLILSQFCYAERIEGDFDQWEVGEHIEDVDGAHAKMSIYDAIMNGCGPIYVNGYIMGYIEDGQGYIYTDCDEMTYLEYYGELYEA